MGIQRVTNIHSNGAAQNLDYDVSMLWKWLLASKGGVIFSDLVTKAEFVFDKATGILTAGAGIANAVVLCTRPTSNPIANQKFLAQFQLFGTVTGLQTTNGTKVYIEIKENLINDPSLIEDPSGSSDFAKGFNIGEIKATAAYPTHPNYIKLWEIDGSGVLVDKREGLSIPYIDDAVAALQDQLDTHEGRLNTIEADIANIEASLQPPSSLISQSIYPLGNAIISLENSCVFKETSPTFAQAITMQNIGDVVGNTRGHLYSISNGIYVSTFKIALKKILSPSVSFNCKLQQYNGSSWVDVDAVNAVATITAGTVTTSVVDTTMTWAGVFTQPIAGTPIRLSCYVGTYGSETINSTNYYQIGYYNINTTTRNLSTRNGTTETNTGFFPYWNYGGSYQIMLSLTNSNYSYKVDLYGIVSNIGSIGTFPNIYIPINGITLNNFTCTSGLEYLLSSTPGGIINSIQTNNIHLGTAVATNKLEIDYQKLQLMDDTTSIVANQTSGSGNVTSAIYRFARGGTAKYTYAITYYSVEVVRISISMDGTTRTELFSATGSTQSGVKTWFFPKGMYVKLYAEKNGGSSNGSATNSLTEKEIYPMVQYI